MDKVVKEMTEMTVMCIHMPVSIWDLLINLHIDYLEPIPKIDRHIA